MQRRTAANTQNLCGFLKLLLTGLGIIHVFFVVVVFVLVAAAGRSVCLPLLVLAAPPSLAGAPCARILRHLLGLSPCRAARTRPFAARRAARPACSSGGHGPWCGGSCSTVCWCRPACRRPPRPGNGRIRQSSCQSYQPGPSWRRLHRRTAQQPVLLGSSSSCCSAAGSSSPERYHHCQILLLQCSLQGVSSPPQHVHTCRPGHIAR